MQNPQPKQDQCGSEHHSCDTLLATINAVVRGLRSRTGIVVHRAVPFLRDPSGAVSPVARRARTVPDLVRTLLQG